ncbi:unnamed protein product [Euphydryas editha]|uniref:Transposable element P transposase-like RNase H domain-containing protein n=1 Tax=Euphydryas editha TaxID=104508 RepID=A0AAU9UNZ4_EUPED|nr:unnamed protein product [Euphydryas editha]
MSITPQIFYSPQKEQFEGFTSNDKEIFADHAFVFMVTGVKNNFKQPVAYYFTNSLTKLELKQNLRSVIDHCFQSSLIIVNTVCDQSSANVGAITELIQETKATYLRQGKEWHHEVMRFKGHVVVPLYDTPHLIKGIRNNLITKDISYVTNNEKKIVKWDYFKMVYDADKSYAELRLLNKITEEHINPKKKCGSSRQHNCSVTALLCLCIPNGKDFKGPVKRNTPHHELWKKAKLVLRNIKFIQKVTEKLIAKKILINAFRAWIFFLKEKNITPNVSEENNSIHFNSEVCFDQQHEIDAGQSNYVCGWVLTKCLKNVVKGCKNCKSTLLDNTSNTNNSFIKAKEYQKKKWLCYPSQETENLFNPL